MAQNPAMGKENRQHAHSCAPDLTHLPRSWRLLVPPLWLLFGLWVVAIGTTGVTGDDPSEVWVIPGLLTEILTDSNIEAASAWELEITNFQVKWSKNLCNQGADDNPVMEYLLTRVTACTSYMHFTMQNSICAQEEQS